jgi:hypothetical protein
VVIDLTISINGEITEVKDYSLPLMLSFEKQNGKRTAENAESAEKKSLK